MKDQNKNLNYNVNINAKTDPSVGKVQQTIASLKTNLNSLKEKINIKMPTMPKMDGLKNSFADLKSKSTEFASSIPGLGGAMGMLSNPIAAISAGVVAWGTAMVQTAEDIRLVDDQVKGLTKSTQEMQQVSDQARAMGKTFGKETGDIISAANVMSKQFGISLPEALKKVEDGLVATNGKLNLDDIKEFSSTIKGAGGTADQLIQNMAVSVQGGMFGNKSLDAMKDWQKNIKGGSDSVKDLLTSVGKGDVFKKVQEGSMSSIEAFDEVYKDIDKLSTSKQQQLVALIGGAGDVIGASGAKMLAVNKKSIDELGDKYANVRDINEENKKLTDAQGKATRGLIGPIKSFEKIWIQLQTLFYEISVPIMEIGQEIGKMFKEIFGGKESFSALNIIVEMIKYNFNMIVIGIKGAITIIRGLLLAFMKVKDYLVNVLKKTLDNIFGAGTFDGLKEGFLSAINFISSKFSQMIEMVQKGFEAAGAYLDGDVEKANKLKEESLKAGRALFSTSTEKSSEGGASGSWGEPTTETTGAGKDTGVATTKAMDNAVASSVQGEVRNITINMDAVQKVQQQTINGVSDLDSFKANLQDALISIVADTSNMTN